MISKRDYNRAVKLVKQYESEQFQLVRKKRNSGYYSVLYLLETDAPEGFRERLIKASSPNAAINKFMRNAPISLKWVDEDLQMNQESYYIGNNPLVLNYL